MTMEVSNPDRLVFPEIGRTKGDVVAYYERIAPRAFPHVAGRPVSIRRAAGIVQCASRLQALTDEAGGLHSRIAVLAHRELDPNDRISA